MWNKICPNLCERIFHIYKVNISQQSYFTCPKGQVSLKKPLPKKWLFLVEMMGVEPMSENLFPKLSTSVVYLLKFPWRSADKQAFLLGSPLNRDKVQGSPLFTCTTKWRSYPSRGTLGKNGSWLKQLLKLFYYCQLFLKVWFLKRYHASARL